MNDSLIKQLELAIAVIKGEIPHDEIECRHERNSNWDKKVTPINSWEFHPYEYRRKPKPLEKWVNTYTDGSSSSFERKCDAVDSADEDHNSCVIERIAVHMKEVL